MRKLKLDPNQLRVESFSPAHESREYGTVHGHSYPAHCLAPSDSNDPALETCGYATCAGDTCWQSCNATTCGCGPGSTQCYSIGYTHCFGDPSCMEQCLPSPICE